MKFVKQTAGAAALGAALLIGSGLSAPSAQAAYIETLQQVGSDVVASGSGAINLAGLSFDGRGSTLAATMFPGIGVIITGPVSFVPLDGYSGFTGPTSFGGGGPTNASSGGGDIVGINNAGHQLYVPAGYVSGSPLSDTATYAAQTFMSLGVTTGTYIWTWGSGVNADSFTLDIVAPTSVPEPTSLALFGTALAGLFLIGFAVNRRSRRADLADSVATLPIR